MEGIKETNDTLTSFGMGFSENNLNIPLTLDFLLGMVSQGDGTSIRKSMDKDRICYYETNSKEMVLKCKCNCGFEVKADDFHDDSSKRKEFDVSQLDLSQPPPSTKPCLTTPAHLSTQFETGEGNSGIRVPSRTSKTKPYERHGESQDRKPTESQNKQGYYCLPRPILYDDISFRTRLRAFIGVYVQYILKPTSFSPGLADYNQLDYNH